MRRKRVPTSWFRRLTHPFREFLRVDIDMTEQALRRYPAAHSFFCAPSRFMLWFLDFPSLAGMHLFAEQVQTRFVSSTQGGRKI